MLDLKDLYQILESRRRALGLTQADVGQRAFGRADNSALQNIRRGAWPSADRLSALCKVLGVELTLDTDITAPTQPKPDKLTFSSNDMLPMRGLAACSAQGWANAVNDRSELPRPFWTGSDPAFWARARGQSMVPDGINSGDFCVVSSETKPVPGHRVWIREASFEGRVAIKRLIAFRDDAVLLQGWLPPLGGAQQSFEELRPLAGIAEIFPVIGVYRGRPGQTEHPVTFIEDPAKTDAPADDPLCTVSLSSAARSDDNNALLRIGFPAAWLGALGVQEKSCTLLTVSDNSLAPQIPCGATVLIDLSDTETAGGGIFALKTPKTTRVACIEDMKDGAFYVPGDGGAVPARISRFDNDPELSVLGRVVWTCQQIHPQVVVKR